MTPEQSERLTRLEDASISQKEILKEMREDLRQLKAEWNRTKGFIGGFIFVLSSVWTAIIVFKDQIKRLIS